MYKIKLNRVFKEIKTKAKMDYLVDLGNILTVCTSVMT